MAWKINYYQTGRGNYPVQDFIEEQDLKTYAKIISSIDLLSKHGPLLKPPDIKKLQNNLYELRIFGKIAVRIFYTFYKGEYYLLNAFKKKSQKTPLKELKIALDRMKEVI